MWLGQLYAWPCEASVEIGVVSKQKVWSAYPDLLGKSTSTTAQRGKKKNSLRVLGVIF